MIEGTDDDRLRIEHALDLVADQIEDGLHIQFGCQAFLHTVDDRKFGGALFGFFEQALGLIEEAGILQRHTHGVGERLQQAHIRFTEGMSPAR